jgi:membrane glycosyltransferase
MGTIDAPRSPAAIRAEDGYGFLPAENPLAMVSSRLWSAAPPGRAPNQHASAMPLRRVYIFAGTAVMTLAGGYEMYEVLQVGGVTILEGLVLGLFVLLFAWIAFSFVSALAGFSVLLLRKREALQIDTSCPLPSIVSRTAMLLPTYNEDAHRIMARLQAIHESVEETGAGARFDWFVLSDTTDPAIWIAEEASLLQLRRNCNTGRLYYRHRVDNTARKSGNIAEWIGRFGASYDHMIILDADSLMTGDTIVRLAAAMELHPDVALIQTLPIVVNARSLFSRLQQFAGRLYGPLIAAGIAWWHGADGNYWGHNAIIRVHAFARDAGLPELRGRKPFGGHILSHDFVEAALMRRAGWGVHMAPTLGGSFEECPPSLLDFAARDRRWCQGNLQHLAVLPARGLYWISRLHLMTGIGSYLTAPLWLLFLMLGILISLQAQFVRPEYFSKGFSLFPKWPAQDPILAAWVFGGTMGLLIVPKILAYILLLTQRDNRRAFGGMKALAGILLETLLSALIAPVMMIFQSTAVGEILLGRDAGWQVQRRDDGGVTRRELYRKYTIPTLCGVAMALSAYAVSVPLFLWMSPVILGLLLAIPLGFATSASSRAAGLFATPEETVPPHVLLRANELAAVAGPSPIDAFSALRSNPALLKHHLDSIGSRRERRRGQIDPHLAVARAKIDDAETFEEAVGYLTARETVAVLNDRRMLERMMKIAPCTAANLV